MLRRCLPLVCALGALALAAPASARTHPGFEVGAAKASITPTDFTNFYLGGYGIGPSHLAQGVLRPVYARAIAVRDRSGNQVVMAALDVQGEFLAYQQGPYGFADIADDIQRRLGIPASHMILQAIHTHNGPDDLGVWGGVPDSYLAYVKAQTEQAIQDAVAAERPADVSWGTADMTGFSGTFGSNEGDQHTGDNTDYPLDNQLRVLQARGHDGRVIATMVNYSTHPTVYGPLDKLSPDWPGATADFLEHNERNIPNDVRYGYPGSVAVVTVGALGHAWPAGQPHGSDPAVDPGPQTDNHNADLFGNAVARMAMSAMQSPRSVGPATVDGAGRALTVASMNPVLVSLLVAPVPGFHIMRNYEPPYGAGDTFTTRATALRIGDLAFFSSPGEAYPTIQRSLASEVHTPAAFVMSLAWDQLGYIEEASDYNGAFQCSAGDEWFFTISPLFGSQLLRAQRANARELGFRAPNPPAPGDAGPGPIPPSTNCTMQQLSGIHP
jgi:hypothetical protein